MIKLLKNKKVIIILSIILIMIIILVLSKDKILKIIYPKNYEEYVNKYAQTYEVEPNLIYALIKAESNFNERSISNKGAIGLMQLMENTAKDVIKTESITIDNNNIKNELLNIDININIGTNYLKKLLNKYPSKGVAIAAYNAGSGTVDNWIEKGILKPDGSNIENIPYKETNNYVRKILRDYQIYNELYK